MNSYIVIPESFIEAAISAFLVGRTTADYKGAFEIVEAAFVANKVLFISASIVRASASILKASEDSFDMFFSMQAGNLGLSVTRNQPDVIRIIN